MILLPWRERFKRNTFAVYRYWFGNPARECAFRGSSAHHSVGADRRRIAQIRGDPGIAKISFPAFRDIGFALRPLIRERCLPLQRRRVELGENVIGEGEHE
ncbi:MAG: hypothetical protein ACT4O2_14500, partial [Beijerinckiaceae bacterium]